MLSQSRSPGAAGQSGSVAAWDVPANAEAQDSVYATASFTGSGVYTSTNVLSVTTFGFTIPAGATINGVGVSYWKWAQIITPVSDLGVGLVGAFGSSSNYATGTAWPSTNTNVGYGSNTDLWGLNNTTQLTPTNVNASSFGVQVSAQIGSAFSTCQVDYIGVTVYYTAAVYLGRPPSITRYGIDSKTLGNLQR